MKIFISKDLSSDEDEVKPKIDKEELKKIH